jgi:hypothetical protein
MRSAVRIVAVAAIVAASVSCGDKVRQGRSPSYLIINSLQAAQGNNPGKLSGVLFSDVVTMVTQPAPCSTATPCPTIFGDVAVVTFTGAMKDIGTPQNPLQGSSANSITVHSMHISYRRADGRNTPGVDVPFGFDAAATATVYVGGSTTIGFEIVRHAAKEESPLVQLATSATIITTICDITFYGTDQAGNEVSVTGSVQIDFGNFGDAS